MVPKCTICAVFSIVSKSQNENFCNISNFGNDFLFHFFPQGSVWSTYKVLKLCWRLKNHWPKYFKGAFISFLGDPIKLQKVKGLFVTLNIPKGTRARREYGLFFCIYTDLRHVPPVEKDGLSELLMRQFVMRLKVKTKGYQRYAVASGSVVPSGSSSL